VLIRRAEELAEKRAARIKALKEMPILTKYEMLCQAIDDGAFKDEDLMEATGCDYADLMHKTTLLFERDGKRFKALQHKRGEDDFLMVQAELSAYDRLEEQLKREGKQDAQKNWFRRELRREPSTSKGRKPLQPAPSFYDKFCAAAARGDTGQLHAMISQERRGKLQACIQRMSKEGKADLFEKLQASVDTSQVPESVFSAISTERNNVKAPKGDANVLFVLDRVRNHGETIAELKRHFHDKGELVRALASVKRYYESCYTYLKERTSKHSHIIKAAEKLFEKEAQSRAPLIDAVEIKREKLIRSKEENVQFVLSRLQAGEGLQGLKELFHDKADLVSALAEIKRDHEDEFSRLTERTSKHSSTLRAVESLSAMQKAEQAPELELVV
jgi:hypothetical protein